MSFISILGENGFRLKQSESDFLGTPIYFNDLNLVQIVDMIRNTCPEYDLKKYYYTLVDNKADIYYRQEVLKDFYNEKVFEAAHEFSYGLLRARTYRTYSEKAEHPIQSKRWKIDAAYMYILAVVELEKSLKECELTSRGMNELREYLTTKVNDEAFIEFTEKTKSLADKMLSLEFEIEFERHSIKIAPKKNDVSYIDKIDELLYDESKRKTSLSRTFSSPLAGALRIARVEDKIIQVLMKEHPEVFKELDEFGNRYNNFLDEVLVKLEDEMQFYISFVLFRRKLEKYDFKFCVPTISDAGKEEFAVCDAYDLALACKNAYEGKPVVPNSLDYRDKERFLVITGPNQGGKTTLARGIGQIVYFSMLGLEAPAGKVTVPIFNDIMTHFEVEESLDTGAGKLKEELKRLKPMMESEHERCFIVLNELFTTAASYDAYMMGSHVIKHFIEDDYYGIYVTHIQELARETEQIASLVAGIADDGKTRTYKIERKPAEGIGHASTLVDKYRLNYEEIKERLNR